MAARACAHAARGHFFANGVETVELGKRLLSSSATLATAPTDATYAQGLGTPPSCAEELKRPQRLRHQPSNADPHRLAAPASAASLLPGAHHMRDLTTGWRARRVHAHEGAPSEALPATLARRHAPTQSPSGFLPRYPVPVAPCAPPSPAGARAYHATPSSADSPARTPSRASKPFTWDDVMPRPRPQRLIAEAKASTTLSDSDLGAMYPLVEDVIPEAFEQWYDNREAKSARSYPVEGGGAVRPLPHFVAGCGGLQHEFAQSRYPYIMYREGFKAFWELCQSPQDVQQQRLLVRGAPGCGKSMLLAATAERLRREGWIVMYIPDCAEVTMRNMFYSRNEETGMFDTRDTAQNILRSMAEAHGKQLERLPQQVEGGKGTLFDLVSLPGSATNASICAAVVRLKLELYRLPAAQPSAVLLDNYNALFWLTQVYEASSLTGPLRRADAQELTLAANLRVLSDVDVGSTTVAAGVSLSGELPDVPLGLDADAASYEKFVLPPLGIEELGSLLQYYRYVEALAPGQAITKAGVEAAHLLTQGDGKLVRRNLHFLLPYDEALDNMDAIGERYSGTSLRPSAQGGGGDAAETGAVTERAEAAWAA